MRQALIARLQAMQRQLIELEAAMADPDVAASHTRLADLSRRRAALLPICRQFETFQRAEQQAADLQRMTDQEPDADLREMARAELPAALVRVEELFEKIKGDLVTSEDRAISSIILELRAGVGGDEAGIWAGDLFEMYQRYAALRGWRLEVMDASPAEMGGYKQIIANVKGEGVWLHLGYESGTHCVKRVPATEMQGRVHTSTATVAVLPEPETVQVEIPESEVKIDVTTAQGPGGQNVNKVATAVKMIHLPTGIEVRMQDTKSQQQNRQRAWQLLRARVFEHYQRLKDAQRAAARSKMIGNADRSERIRTYRFKDNLCVDHRINRSCNLQEILAGRLDDLVDALIEQDKLQRLADLPMGDGAGV